MGFNIGGITGTDNGTQFIMNNGTADLMRMGKTGLSQMPRQISAASTGNYGGIQTGAQKYTFSVYYNTGNPDDPGAAGGIGQAGWDYSNYWYVIPVTGIYHFTWNVIMYPGGGYNNGHMYISINGNGGGPGQGGNSPYFTAYRYGGGGSWKTAHCNVIYSGNAGDQVWVYVNDVSYYHGNNGAGLTVSMMG
jgi:hypothetical protein